MALTHSIQVALGKSLGSLRHRRDLPAPDRGAVQALREACRSQPPLPTDGLSGAALAWVEHCNTFRNCCIEMDPERFMDWPVVRKTMYVDASRYLRLEYEALRSRPDFESKWLPVIRESWVGDPPRFWLDGQTSGNRVHMAYHLARYEDATGIDPASYDAVLEFGGGYGCMCDTLHRKGFAGRYLIFDLPIQSALQQYFLKRNGRALVPIDQTGPGITCFTDPAQLDQALAQLAGKRLFLATWSLSEAPPEVREPFDDASQRFDGCLIGYQKQFEQVDNRAYFARWSQTHAQMKLHSLPIDHLPGATYLFGA